MSETDDKRARREAQEEERAWYGPKLHAADARIAELEAALRPFVVLADAIFECDDKPDEWPMWGYNAATVTRADFRRARAALSGKQKSCPGCGGRGGVTVVASGSGRVSVASWPCPSCAKEPSE
jgi:hypothetical protein